MAKTGVRVAITLACTECKRRNYQTNKSKRNTPDRVEFKQVLPLVRAPHAAPGDPLDGPSDAWHSDRSARDATPPAERRRPRASAPRRRPAAQPAAKADEQPRRERRGASARFVRECVAELKKVEWPNQRQVIQATVVVIIACAIVGAYLWVADQASSAASSSDVSLSSS